MKDNDSIISKEPKKIEDQKTSEECEPIFLVGSARTGTSILVGALQLGANIPGYKEGHYLTLLLDFVQAAVSHTVERRRKDPSPEVMMARFGANHITDDIMHMMKVRQESHFSGKKVWFDKTPDGLMLRTIPYVTKMWPKARFIFTKRRAIENISSRLRKFTHLTFERNCEHWAMAMKLWLRFKENIPESQRLEIDQREMGLDPEGTAQKIGTFLRFNDSQIKGMAAILKEERYEFTGGNEKVVKSLADMNWSEEQFEIYNRVCAPVNKEFGYSEDSTYYL